MADYVLIVQFLIFIVLLTVRTYEAYMKMNDVTMQIHGEHQVSHLFFLCQTTRPFGQLNGSDNSTVRTTRRFRQLDFETTRWMAKTSRRLSGRPAVTVMFTQTFLYNSCDSIIYYYYLSVIIYHKKVWCPSEAILAYKYILVTISRLCEKTDYDL